MLRVILADDEAVIVKGLKRLIDWKKMDAVIIGEAGNGKEALKLIREKKPDLVISDISMPELDGLELLKEINRMGLCTRVIFISGYQEFSYAKKAVTLGAVDYILKPVEKAELEGAIRRAAGMIDEKSRLSILDEGEKETELADIFRRINGEQSYGEQELYRQFEALDIDVSGREFVGTAFRLYMTRSAASSNIKIQELQKFAAYNRLQKKLEEEGWGFVIKKELNTCYTIFLLEPGEEKRVLHMRARKLAEVMTSGYPMVVKIGFGEWVKEIGSLQLAYKTSRFALELYYFTEEDEIWYDHIERRFEDSFEDYQECYIKLLNAYLSRKTSIDSEINRILLVIKNLHFGSRTAAVNRCVLLITEITQDLIAHYLIDSDYREKGEHVAEEIRSRPLYRQACSMITEYLKELFEIINEGIGNSEVNEIARIKQYISQNFRENLTLEAMAEVANMNLYYFSSYFKKNTGENFKNYLTGIRMKEAEKLLRNTDYKAYEIAEAVGYKNVRQFNENFKSAFGKSPNEYRREMRKS